jgi:serine/threonine protein kinase
MELIEAGEMFEAIQKKGSFSEDEAKKIFLKIMKGIQYLHGFNFIFDYNIKQKI